MTSVKGLDIGVGVQAHAHEPLTPPESSQKEGVHSAVPPLDFSNLSLTVEISERAPNTPNPHTRMPELETKRTDLFPSEHGAGRPSGLNSKGLTQIWRRERVAVH
jgi:hypothetical protein